MARSTRTQIDITIIILNQVKSFFDLLLIDVNNLTLLPYGKSPIAWNLEVKYKNSFVTLPNKHFTESYTVSGSA